MAWHEGGKNSLRQGKTEKSRHIKECEQLREALSDMGTDKGAAEQSRQLIGWMEIRDKWAGGHYLRNQRKQNLGSDSSYLCFSKIVLTEI